MITNTAIIYGKNNTFVIDFVYLIILYTDNILVAFFLNVCLLETMFTLKYFANITLLVSVNLEAEVFCAEL